jgi:hypothetical protein
VTLESVLHDYRHPFKGVTLRDVEVELDALIAREEYCRLLIARDFVGVSLDRTVAVAAETFVTAKGKPNSRLRVVSVAALVAALHPTVGLLLAHADEANTRAALVVAEASSRFAACVDILEALDSGMRRRVADMEDLLREALVDEFSDRWESITFADRCREARDASVVARRAQRVEEEAAVEAQRKAQWRKEVEATFEREEAERNKGFDPRSAIPTFDSAAERLRRAVFHQPRTQQLMRSQGMHSGAGDAAYAGAPHLVTLLRVNIPLDHNLPSMDARIVLHVPPAEEGRAPLLILRTDAVTRLHRVADAAAFAVYCGKRNYRPTVLDMNDAVHSLYAGISAYHALPEAQERETVRQLRDQRPPASAAEEALAGVSSEREEVCERFVSALKRVVEALVVAWCGRFRTVDIEADDPLELLHATLARRNVQAELHAANAVGLSTAAVECLVLQMVLLMHDLLEREASCAQLRCVARLARVALLSSNHARDRGVLGASQVVAAMQARRASLEVTVSARSSPMLHEMLARVNWLTANVGRRLTAAADACVGVASAKAKSAGGETAATACAELPHVTPSFLYDVLSASANDQAAGSTTRSGGSVTPAPIPFFTLFPRGLIDVLRCLANDVLWHPLLGESMSKTPTPPATSAAVHAARPLSALEKARQLLVPHEKAADASSAARVVPSRRCMRTAPSAS